MMFYNAKINDSITVFIKTSTEEQVLCEILEKLDNNENTNLKISKWQSSDGFLQKNIDEKAVIEDASLSQKCLYIINSIKMSFNFSYTLIDEENKKEISNIKIVKINKSGKYLLPNDFLNGAGNRVGILLIHAKPESVSFEHDSVAFLLQDGSLVISNSNDRYTINNSSDDTLYLAYGEFVDIA